MIYHSWMWHSTGFFLWNTSCLRSDKILRFNINNFLMSLGYFHYHWWLYLFSLILNTNNTKGNLRFFMIMIYFSSRLYIAFHIYPNISLVVIPSTNTEHSNIYWKLLIVNKDSTYANYIKHRRIPNYPQTSEKIFNNFALL